MPAQVYVLGYNSNQDLVIRSPIKYFEHHFIGEPMAGRWVVPEIRILGARTRVRDFVSWMNSAPVLSEKARDALGPIISAHCEILPLIELSGSSYFAVNVLAKVDCLDKEKSDILYSSDDPTHILSISSYHLRRECIPADAVIFKLPEDDGCVFVTGRFVEAVIENNLRGAAFMDPRVDPLRKIARGERLNVVPDLAQ
jgi:hypothetical protein